MKIKLLKQLTLQPKSIQQLATALNLTSLMVLQLIAKINQLEPNLISNQAQLYSLSRKLNLLDETQIQTNLTNADLNYHILILEQIGSTNSYALAQIKQLPHRTLISAEWQFSGRGRFNRQWQSTIAHDLTCSIIYHLEPEFNLTIIPLICALAVNRSLKNYAIASKIKWPNDIYLQQQKIAGILVENIKPNNLNCLVIGIGLDNTHNLERNQLQASLVTNLENVLMEYKTFGFALLRQEWLDNCSHLKQKISIMHNNEIISQGVHQDISNSGELIIQTATELQTFSSANISLLLD